MAEAQSTAAQWGPPQEETELTLPLREGIVLAETYQIEYLAGQGGMAHVYKAKHMRLGKSVAIKVLHTELSNNKHFITKFREEAAALANLSHPNIISIQDRQEERGIYYLVVEFIDGPELDDLIVERKIEPMHWPQIIKDCREALSYIHSCDIIHLDIKPSNIMLDHAGRAKISDFGIAQIMREDETVEQKKRKPSGTSNYMAPEQVEGIKTLDPRADVFALAATFFKMFTGRMLPPEFDQVPSAAQFNRSVPKEADAVLEKALAKNRDDRYSTVEEFCNRLLGALGDPDGVRFTPAPVKPGTKAERVPETGSKLLGGLSRLLGRKQK